MTEQLSKTIEINVRGNVYVVTFPNNRGLMKIFTRKAQLSNEMYDALAFSVDGNAKYVSYLIDAFAHFETVMPEQFFKDINVKNIVDTDVLIGAEIVRIYREQYEGWFNKWTAAIAKVLTPEEKKEEVVNVQEQS